MTDGVERGLGLPEGVRWDPDVDGDPAAVVAGWLDGLEPGEVVEASFGDEDLSPEERRRVDAQVARARARLRNPRS